MDEISNIKFAASKNHIVQPEEKRQRLLSLESSVARAGDNSLESANNLSAVAATTEPSNAATNLPAAAREGHLIQPEEKRRNLLSLDDTNLGVHALKPQSTLGATTKQQRQMLAVESSSSASSADSTKST